MKITYKFTEVEIEGVKHYRAKGNFVIDAEEYQSNFQSEKPITKEDFEKQIKEYLNEKNISFTDSTNSI